MKIIRLQQERTYKMVNLTSVSIHATFFDHEKFCIKDIFEDFAKHTEKHLWYKNTASYYKLKVNIRIMLAGITGTLNTAALYLVMYS